jgi:hypothetical protein
MPNILQDSDLQKQHRAAEEGTRLLGRSSSRGWKLAVQMAVRSRMAEQAQMEVEKKTVTGSQRQQAEEQRKSKEVVAERTWGAGEEQLKPL